METKNNYIKNIIDSIAKEQEALSNIINTHRKKSSFTFAPIIALLKKS